MSLTSRVLPPDEWPTLAGTTLEALWPLLDPSPERTRLVVVEEDGTIVGHWAFFLVMHAECVEIMPSHRKRGAVARHLLRAMKQAVAAWGLRGFVTGTVQPDAKALIEEHLRGVPIPSTMYSVTVQEDTPWASKQPSSSPS